MKRLEAALIFFTRLPFWRIWNPPAESFGRVTDWWSAVGWLTGGVAAGVLFCAAHVVSMPVAVILAVAARVMLTGSLHEDGLADFFDSFGAHSREAALRIMKDSHIGTYGVVGLVLYFLLLVSSLASLPAGLACAGIFAADAWSKFCASQIVNFLPYARPAEQAKIGTAYRRMSLSVFLIAFIFGALPLLLLPGWYMLSAIAPVLAGGALILLFRHRFGGYTGDCCGAMFLLCELSMVIALSALFNCGIWI